MRELGFANVTTRTCVRCVTGVQLIDRALSSVVLHTLDKGPDIVARILLMEDHMRVFFDETYEAVVRPLAYEGPWRAGGSGVWKHNDPQ